MREHLHKLFQRPDGSEDDLKSLIQSGQADLRAAVRSIEADTPVAEAFLQSKEEAFSLSKLIGHVVGSYLAGRPHEAYTLLASALSDRRGDIDRLCSIPLGDGIGPLFRARTSDHVFQRLSDGFHLPHTLRRFAGRYRFSVDGLPSLYLSGSVYTCWRELQQPPFHRLHVSALRLAPNTLKVLDFGFSLRRLSTIFRRRDATAASSKLGSFIISYLKLWPLVAACHVKRPHSSPAASFHEEYIVPQLLMQWIVASDNIDGIRYRSVHVEEWRGNTGFDWGCNFAFPANDAPGPLFSARLCERFALTPCIPFEVAHSILPEAIEIPNRDVQILGPDNRFLPYLGTQFNIVERKLVGVACSRISTSGTILETLPHPEIVGG